ncbi:SAM-dependent methyltransferase [Streptomyces sp. MMBL 11-1]|uniref:SAM-dependent methyltransferase n=1 Tax=Streptomyces sp. MMBL 11-1 TaxID=3026420 RepID=UPI002361D494|nr:SAM-dependent methyltransferase [Streptomyces sp. MMBL 11-1]
MTVTSRNIDEVLPLGRALAELGVQQLKLHHPRPVGNAADHPELLVTSRDAVALHRGDVHLPGDSQAHALGLIDRLKLEELHEYVEVAEDDFLDGKPLGLQCDAVWTSCSWHYSANHHRPLGEFVDRMQRLVRPGGVFGAEFMMPVERRHHMIEHYTSPERLHPHFIGDWEVLLTLRTTEFTERAHVGQPHGHTHRMGLLLAARTSTLTDHF